MNYWLLTTEYPPFFGGGISTYCRHTAAMLADYGHDVSVFVNDGSVKKIEVKKDRSIRIIRFNPTATKESQCLGHITGISYEFAHIVKQFIEKEGKPDIIEAQEYLGIAYYLLQYKKLLYDWCSDIPVLVTMHSPSFLYMEYNHVSEYRYPNYWICEMERFCLQAADHVISPSAYMMSELNKRFHLSHKNISIIQNPFQFRPSYPAVAERPGEVVFYGKLTAQKGVFQLLKYFKHLWQNGFQKRLYLIGGQDIVYHPEGKSMGDIIRKEYKQYISTGILKLESKILPTELEGRLAKAELVIIPSNNDNLPYVVAEVMSLGKVVLVSKQGGHSEVVEQGINGFVFDHENPDTFYQQLENALNLDKHRYDEISKAAISRVRNYFSYEVVYKRKLEVINILLNAKYKVNSVFPFVRSIDTPKIGDDHYGNEKLSIVIPFYNLGQYLPEAINSVKNSSYKDTEIIIVNDGTTDEFSNKVLNKLRTEGGIVIIDTENKGIANARNIGAGAATGKYLAFLDADDKVLPDYYAKAIRVLKHYDNIHFAGCWVQYFEESDKIWPSFSTEPPLILYHNLVNSSALVYKKRSFLTNGLNDSTMLFPGWEDYESVVAMVNSGKNGIVLPEPLFEYRIRHNSMVRGLSKAKKILLHQHISQKHKDLYGKFATDVFNLQNANGPSFSIDNPSLDYHLFDNLPWQGKSAQKIVKLIKRNKTIKSAAYKMYRFIKK